MATKVRELMTIDPRVVGASETAAKAAQRMRDEDIGDVLVEDDGQLRGIVTDRDLAVRVMAEGIDPEAITVGQVCSGELRTLSPDDDVADAIQRMRRDAIRRMPVVDDGTAVGVLAIGDLATIKDPDSVLADISAQAGNN